MVLIKIIIFLRFTALKKSSRCYDSNQLGIKDDVLSDNNWLDEKGLKSYREFLRQEEKEIDASIRRATSTGRPLGTERFIKKLEKLLGRDIFPKKVGRHKSKK